MTNGEKIKEIFPNIEIIPDPYSPSVDMSVGGIMMMRIDRNWFNADYKEPTIKNDLGVDCISRAEVIEEINSVANDAWDEEQMRVDLIAEINALPSVTPQETRKGYWIEHPHEAGPCWEYSRYECSECHDWAEDDSDYCPYCGAKMIEPQESEKE